MPFLSLISNPLPASPTPPLSWQKLGQRPRAWFGLEDDDGMTDPTVASDERLREQQAWDVGYHALPWWGRLCCHLHGRIPEPVGNYGGMNEREILEVMAARKTRPVSSTLSSGDPMKPPHLVLIKGGRENVDNG